ncbi:hypothetical protein Tco_1470329, partial [Tanacetum coccineum]
MANTRRFETYVKAKDLDLWHIILNGDFPPAARNKETQVLEMVPFEEQDDDLKKKLAKNNEAKMDNKIDLLVQQYEQFTILEEEFIDSGFARFNTIITSLKALDEGFSSKNYVRKFLRALHPKRRAKVTDSKIYRGQKERVKSIALKAKKESSDDETCLISQSSNEVTLNSSHYSDNASSLDND